MTVRVVDKGAKKMKRFLAELTARKPSIRVGVIGDAAKETYDGGVTLADVAGFHEYGTATVPMRSWLRAWFDATRTKNKRAMKLLLERAAKSATAEIDQVLGLMGADFVGQIQERIQNGLSPALADSTVDRKLSTGMGGSTPLIATGRFIGSITWDVEDNA